MIDAPSPVHQEQLDELHLKQVPVEKKVNPFSREATKLIIKNSHQKHNLIQRTRRHWSNFKIYPCRYFRSPGRVQHAHVPCHGWRWDNGDAVVGLPTSLKVEAALFSRYGNHKNRFHLKWKGRLLKPFRDSGGSVAAYPQGIQRFRRTDIPKSKLWSVFPACGGGAALF